jgi:hypothetical protein
MRFGISHAVFALVATTASATSAFAQEAPPPAQVETLDSAARDSNVSTIHGQLVPVGEKNEYLVAFKPTNISINPIGAMMGFYSGSLSFAVSQNVALRADASYFAPIDSESTGFQVGVSAPIYLRRTYQGAFVEPGIMARTMTHKDSYDGSTRTYKEFGPEVLLGWHWSWDSGLNAAIAFGVGRNLNHGTETDVDTGDAEYVDGYLRIGYEF